MAALMCVEAAGSMVLPTATAAGDDAVGSPFQGVAEANARSAAVRLETPQSDIPDCASIPAADPVAGDQRTVEAGWPRVFLDSFVF